MTGTGIIMKALSGFYYVDPGDGSLIACRARGKFRHQHITPLVGDRVEFTKLEEDSGMVDEILPRKNEFLRPAVANIDQMVIIVSQAIPITDPFLIDRMTSLAESKRCESIICINKCDLKRADELFDIYTAAGFPTVRVSAETGEGIDTLASLIAGKVSAFTGNSRSREIQYSQRTGTRLFPGGGSGQRTAGAGTAHHPARGTVPTEKRSRCGGYARVFLL